MFQVQASKHLFSNSADTTLQVVLYLCIQDYAQNHTLVLMTHALSLLQALKKVPGVNSSWHGDFIRQYHNIDISIAVQTPNGLMVPVVRNSDSKGLTEIGAAVKALAGKVWCLLPYSVLCFSRNRTFDNCWSVRSATAIFDEQDF